MTHRAWQEQFKRDYGMDPGIPPIGNRPLPPEEDLFDGEISDAEWDTLEREWEIEDEQREYREWHL